LASAKQPDIRGTLIDKFLTIEINLDSMSIAYHGRDVNEWRYDSTPKNALITASTGVDGCHYCVVPKEGLSVDESPIYYISPMDWDDTVIWVAKDFVDFLSIGVAMGSFTYISCHPSSKEELMQFVEEAWLEDNESEKKEAIKLLEKHFPLRRYCGLYEHITESYKNVNNHAELEFEMQSISTSRLGHYSM